NHTARQGLRRRPDARGQSAATACASWGRDWKSKRRRHLFEIWEVADQKCVDARPIRFAIAPEIPCHPTRHPIELSSPPQFPACRTLLLLLRGSANSWKGSKSEVRDPRDQY